MDELSALDYCRLISESMEGTEVSDNTGSKLSLVEGTERAIQLVLDTQRSSKKIMLAGNGGSSSVVSHVQNDLCKAVGARAMVFTEQPLLTALANDEGYGSVFEKPIELWAEKGDVLVTVSSSGKSENIVRALKSGSELGCRIVTLSGFSPDNPSRSAGEINFYVPSDIYGVVETVHMAILHFITDRAMASIGAHSEYHVGA